LRTTEYQPPKTYSPGIAEESIWNTGEMVHDEDGYLASEFKDNKRQVCFKFTRNENIYNNEVRSRSKLGMKEGDSTPNHILPLLCHFNASVHGRYRLDVSDDRFKILHCYGGESICLSDYPYALVYPHSDEGDLYDYSFHQGVHQENEIADIGLQVGKALKLMHEKSVIHRNLSMRCVTMLPFDNEVQNPQRTWAITNFSGASYNSEAEFMGAISPDGSAQFQTGLLPPEMFTKISNSEQRIYRAYWEKIEKTFNIQINRIVKEPYVDITTGCSYIVRCHYVVDDREKTTTVELPELPYKLVQARESVDFWCLGILLYTLCSGGRPLFPVNLKSGHLLDHRDIVNWNMDSARTNIYENVKDLLAQDLLLILLSPFEDRNNVTMDTVMSHPYFAPTIKSPLRDKIIDHRKSECAAHIRNNTKLVTAKYEDDWLASRTVNVHCWNFDMLKTIYFSSSEIIRKLIGQSYKMPSSFVLLPYKLSSKNKKAKLAPTTKKDVERAERMGVLLLFLAKTLSFGSCVEEAIEKSVSGQKWDARSLLESATIPSNAYEDLKEEFYEVAAAHIEAFRVDPRSAVTKLVERRYYEIRAIFKDARKAFLYLVDEHMGIPLVGQAYAPYPFEIPESNIESSLSKMLPFMHSCSMVVRGASGGISGIVRLIFEAAFPHVPQSWSDAGSGLVHSLDEDLIKREIMILHRTMCGLNPSRERKSLGGDLSAINSMCTKVDVRGDFANLHRVQCAGSSLWTTPSGLKLIQEACDEYDFEQAMKIQADLETKLKSQEQLIKQLRDKVELMTWHEEFNLNVPQTQSEKQNLLADNDMESKNTVTPSSNRTTLVEKSPQKSVKKAVGCVTSTAFEITNIEKSDILDLESVATANSKSTLRDQISVD